MLRELKIENLAIIEELDLEFQEGFVVLTGETGAGKSIILSGINLLIGEKASVDMIRDGENSLLAQGVFDITEKQEEELQKFGISIEDGEVVVRRQLDRNGKSKIYVNNIRVNVTELREIMSSLVDIVGQHSHQMLLNKSNHQKLLDHFLEKKGQEIKQEVESLAKEYDRLDKRIKEIETHRQEALEKKEFYEYQLQEIEKLELQEGEDEKLEEEYKKIFHAGQIKEKLYATLYALRDGEYNVSSLLHQSKKNVENLGKYGKEFQDAYESLETISYQLDDCLGVLDELQDSIEVEEGNLDQISKRLDEINRIKNKYNGSIKDILMFRERIADKINFLDENNLEVKNLIEKRKQISQNYQDKALQLHNERWKIAHFIEKELEQELQFLKMEEARLHVQFHEKEGISPEGMEEIEFFISTNLGQSMKPLAKIASGGEVSRIMLAIKVLFSRVDQIPILIFDEIDVGVGGETVKKIGDKLQEIGQRAQVISITHSPAIAARASQQFYIEKDVSGEKTLSSVTELGEEERIREIARMLSGEQITDSVLELAKEMLEEGRL